MSIRPAALLFLLLAAAMAGCGQTGPLVLPENSSPKQGYLLVDKPPPGTVAAVPVAKPQGKATSVPTPTTPFPPQAQPTRSVLSNNSTP